MILAFKKAKLGLLTVLWGVFFSGAVLAQNNFKLLSQDPQWQKLLHYEENFWGETFTRADSKSFFVSEKGAEDEEAELLASYLEATSKKRFDWICRFPARYHFLVKHKLVGHNFSWEKECPELAFFRDQLSAKSVSMVFSSYYVNTPASAFGHTLLRFNKSSGEKNGSELLDRAINYSASVTTSNALIYAILGMTGGFYGEFAMLPYFYKLREYNDFESRDLWSYELNLTNSEIHLLIDHIWEMKQTLIDYYYLTENCSFYMMALLDAVNPNWGLLARGKGYTIPGDTMLTLQQTPGMIKSVSYRPSLRKKLYQRFQNLNKTEKKAFYDHEELEKLPRASQVRVLDTILENQDFTHSYKILTNDEELSNKKRELLIKRSQFQEKLEPIEMKTPYQEAPHNAHGSTRLRLFYGSHEKWDSLLGVELRYALHDKSDPPLGYGPHMEIDFVKIRAAFTSLDYQGEKKHRILFEGMDLVRVASHNPYTSFFKDFSWEFRAGIESLEDLGSTFKLSPGIDLLGGYYFELGRFASGIFLKGKAQTSSFFDKSYSLRVGPQWQLYYLQEKWSLGVKAELLYYLPKEVSDLSYRAEAYLSLFLSRNMTFFSKWDWAKNEAFDHERNRYWAGVSFYY